MGSAAPPRQGQQEGAAPRGVGRPDVSPAAALARLGALAVEFREALGRIDHVTLLPNRTSFIEDMTARAAAAEMAADHALILVTLADARHFNEILRALGHAYSEDFVKRGAERLLELLPAGTDVYHVSVLSLAFFAEKGQGDRPAIVDDIVATFRRPLVCRDIPIDTRVGVGISLLEADGRDPAELLRATLAAAQDSRRTAEGWAWYNKSTDDAHLRAFTLLSDLKPAIERGGELFLDYQPRVIMRSRQCVSAEALLRWRHPRLGLISPMEFIPLAEATALITPLTRAVIEMGMRQLAEWRKHGRELSLSVNVSPKNVLESDFFDFLIDCCEKHGIAPSALELEFTEGTLSADSRATAERLTALHKAGVEIAIDDFGSGYSNMSYLTTLPAQTIKIDQSFVRPLGTRPKNEILIRSIIELGHQLGYKVVAEGIETAESFDRLSAWHCDEGQGYFMSRPLPPQDLVDWLGAWR